MSTLTATVPLNDSLRVRYSVRDEADQSLISLTGFTLTLVIKASPSNTAPVIATVVGVLQNPDTSAIFIVPPDVLATAGTFYATARAFDVDESYSESLVIQVTDHA